MNIPEATVEAAAEAYQGRPTGRQSWSELTPMVRKNRAAKMRRALEAVAQDIKTLEQP